MRIFLAILVFASSSASGMIGISSISTKNHNRNFCNKALDNRKVANLKCDNDESLFFLDSDTNSSETSNILHSDSNVLNEGNTFGAISEQDNVHFANANDIEQSDIFLANSYEESGSVRGNLPVSDTATESEQDTESDNVSDYTDYYSDVSKKKEIIYVDNFGAERTTSKGDLNNRESIQWYFDKNYGARNKAATQQYIVPGHYGKNPKLSDNEIRKALDYIRSSNEKVKRKQYVYSSDCSEIFNLSEIGENSSNQSVDQYFEGETSSEL